MSTVSKPDKIKSSKHHLDDEVDINETRHDFVKIPKTPKKKVAKIELSENGKKAWLHEKAAQSTIPSEEDAQIIPDRLFKGLDPLIIHMCEPCKKFNASREISTVGVGMVQIPMAMCTVCRAHLIAQKNIKFYQHDCPTIKKKLNL